MAEPPRFRSGVVSLSRHRYEGALSPHSGGDSAAQISWQSGALGHTDVCHWPDAGNQTENSWRPTDTTRVRRAPAGQARAGFPSDTTHPTQKKRDTATWCLSQMGSLVCYETKGGLGLSQEVKRKSIFYYCSKCSY